MAEDNKRVFARNLKRFMFESGVTRSEICRDLNISYTTLSDWINARTYPRINNIELLAQYFGIKKSNLIEKPYQ